MRNTMLKFRRSAVLLAALLAALPSTQAFADCHALQESAMHLLRGLCEISRGTGFHGGGQSGTQSALD